MTPQWIHFFFISEISEISPKVTKKENKNHRNKNVNYYLFGNFINVFNRVTSPSVMSYGCIWYYFLKMPVGFNFSLTYEFKSFKSVASKFSLFTDNPFFKLN